MLERDDELIAYVSSWLVYTPSWSENVLVNVPDVLWIGRYEEEDKAAPEFEQLLFEKLCPQDISYGNSFLTKYVIIVFKKLIILN